MQIFRKDFFLTVATATIYTFTTKTANFFFLPLLRFLPMAASTAPVRILVAEKLLSKHTVLFLQHKRQYRKSGGQKY